MLFNDTYFTIQKNSEGLFKDKGSKFISYAYPVTTEAEISMMNPVVHIQNLASEDVTNWYYQFGDLSVENFDSGEHWYQQYGPYIITQYVWNSFGCRDTTSHHVVVDPDILIYIPNAFTPDANGHNELFIPVVNGFQITLYIFKIFDRWGIEVFSTTDHTKGWDGTFEGAMSADGAYTWVLDIRNDTDVNILRKTGNVMLLR